MDRNHGQLRTFPCATETPVINFLIFITKTPGVTEDMRTWAVGLLAELQDNEDVDKGGIWMNGSQLGNTA